MGNQIKQILQMKGLDLRTNELLKEEGYATSVSNVELTGEGYLTKRKGFGEHSEEADFIQMMDYIGNPELSNPDGTIYHLLGLKSDGLYGFDEGIGPSANTWVKVYWGSEGTEPTFSEPQSWDEYEGVIYMADPSGVNEIMKFDGLRMYRASLPKPVVTLDQDLDPAIKVWTKVIIEYVDWQGNVILGEDIDLGPTETGFTLTFDTSAYNAGQYPTSSPLLSRTFPRIIVALSEHPTFGFRFAFEARQLISGTADISIYLNPSTIVNSREQGLLSDIYDYTVRKATPPKAKYLDFYNGLMVLGNFKEVLPDSFGFTTNSNKITWSDLSTGGSVEVFPSLNQQEVGKSTNVITGIFGDSDNLVVFKSRNVFYLSGDLVNGNYRLRDSLSEGIGCIAHQSIIKVEGGALFLSEKGLYMAKDGYKPIEFSDIIESFFTNLDNLQMSKSVAVLDRLNEKILLFIPNSDPTQSVIVQYDYYHSAWFILRGIDGSGGFAMHKDELVHTDGVKVFQRHDARNDDGVAIDAHYSTTWMNLNVPSVKKKYTKFLAFSLDQSTWDLTVTTQKNWVETDLQSSVINFPSSVGSEDVGLPAIQSHSLRITMSNDILDQNILINGYEYEYAYTQSRFKGGD